MAKISLAHLESALRARHLDRTLTTQLPSLERSDATRLAPTELPALDRGLGGGFPRGQLSEIVGKPSSGRTTVCLSAMSAATRRGEIAALVDAFDRLDVATVGSARVIRERMLWVRGPVGTLGPGAAAGSMLERTIGRTLKALNLILHAGGFGLVVIDLADAPVTALKRIPLTTWLRVQRTIEGSDTACLVVAPQPLARSAGGVTLALAARREGIRWSGESDRNRRLTGLAIAGRVIAPRRGVDGDIEVAAIARSL